MNDDGKKITMRGIAKEAGVSLSTVSRVFSGDPHATPNIRKKVIGVARTLGYAPNTVTGQKAFSQSNLIGLVVNHPSGFYTSEVIECVEKEVSRCGYDLILCGAYDDLVREERVIASMLNRQVDGMIITTKRDAYSEELTSKLNRIPVVYLGDKPRSAQNCSTVYLDNYYGGVIGTRYLCELGHRNIVFLGRRLASKSQSKRAAGYEQVCREYGIRPRYFDGEGIRTISKEFKLGLSLLQEGALPSAVYAASDITAFGLIQAADTLGVQIPKDISLIGFDNLAFSEISRINLTSLDLPKAKLAQKAVDRLMAELRNESEAEPTDTRLLPNLVIRGSCMRIN